MVYYVIHHPYAYEFTRRSPNPAPQMRKKPFLHPAPPQPVRRNTSPQYNATHDINTTDHNTSHHNNTTQHTTTRRNAVQHNNMMQRNRRSQCEARQPRRLTRGPDQRLSQGQRHHPQGGLPVGRRGGWKGATEVKKTFGRSGDAATGAEGVRSGGSCRMAMRRTGSSASRCTCSDDSEGWREGHPRRKLVVGVGTISLEVGIFSVLSRGG